jgi:predicted nucleotidyltransferase
MPSRFESALALALEDLQSQQGVEGILFFGSALDGTAGPTSDLDLFVILEDVQQWTQISMRRYAGVEAEVHLASGRTWQRRLETGNAIMIGAFATGQALLDRSGRVAELAGLARARAAEGPEPLSALQVDQWRYRLTDLANNLEDVAGQPAEERMLGATLVALSLDSYCELNRLWGDNPKRRLAYVERHNPELGRMVRAYFAGDLDRHLAQAIVDRVLAPHGGRTMTWDSPVRAAED